MASATPLNIYKIQRKLLEVRDEPNFLLHFIIPNFLLFRLLPIENTPLLPHETSTVIAYCNRMF